MRYLFSALAGAIALLAVSTGIGKMVGVAELLFTQTPNQKQARLHEQAAFFNDLGDRALLLAGDRRDEADVLQTEVEERSERLSALHAERARRRPVAVNAPADESVGRSVVLDDGRIVEIVVRRRACR